MAKKEKTESGGIVETTEKKPDQAVTKETTTGGEAGTTTIVAKEPTTEVVETIFQTETAKAELERLKKVYPEVKFATSDFQVFKEEYFAKSHAARLPNKEVFVY